MEPATYTRNVRTATSVVPHPAERPPAGRSRTRREADDTVARLCSLLHELNNALTPVLVNAQLASSRIPDGEPAKDEIVDVVNGARRGCALVGEIREMVARLDERSGSGR